MWGGSEPRCLTFHSPELSYYIHFTSSLKMFQPRGGALSEVVRVPRPEEPLGQLSSGSLLRHHRGPAVARLGARPHEGQSQQEPPDAGRETPTVRVCPCVCAHTCTHMYTHMQVHACASRCLCEYVRVSV